jgi:hypothetical protein
MRGEFSKTALLFHFIPVGKKNKIFLSDFTLNRHKKQRNLIKNREVEIELKINALIKNTAGIIKRSFKIFYPAFTK